MAKDEQLTLTQQEQEKLEAIRVEMGFGSIEEAAQYLLRQALSKATVRMVRKAGKASVYHAMNRKGRQQ